MAADSLFGGSTQLSTIISAESLALLNTFLTDTVGGSAITSSIGGNVMLVGSGDKGTTKAVILPTTSNATKGTMNDGVVFLDLQLPPSVGIAMGGVNEPVTPAKAQEYLESVVDQYLPPTVTDPTLVAQRENLLAAVKELTEAIAALSPNVTVRFVDFVNANKNNSAVPVGAAGAEGADNEVIFDAAGTTDAVFAFNLASLADNQQLVLKNVKSAAVAGAGNVRVDGNTGVAITSDAASQNIQTGGGNDTLIGGGGSDTLTGGAGNDVFEFNLAVLGNYQITDFGNGNDSIHIDMANVNNLGDLIGLIRAVADQPSGVTYFFDNNVSVTLVGVSAAEVTAAMVKFSL